MLSHYFDPSTLAANREETKRKKEEMGRGREGGREGRGGLRSIESENWTATRKGKLWAYLTNHSFYPTQLPSLPI